MSTDISSLTPDELSGWIAEHNEPFVLLPVIEMTLPASSSFPSRANVRPGEESTLGWWKCGPGMKWRVQSYTDPEICLRLQEDLLCKHGYLNTLDLVRECWQSLPANMHYRERWIRAWAEAYALANGFCPEGGK